MSPERAKRAGKTKSKMDRAAGTGPKAPPAAPAVLPNPLRGQVWLADLDPTRGREQRETRPVLIVSPDVFNASPAELVIGLPITKTDRRIRTHVPVAPPEGGLSVQSFIICEQVRALSKERLIRPLGQVSQATLRTVEGPLKILLGF